MCLAIVSIASGLFAINRLFRSATIPHRRLPCLPQYCHIVSIRIDLYLGKSKGSLSTDKLHPNESAKDTAGPGIIQIARQPF